MKLKLSSRLPEPEEKQTTLRQIAENERPRPTLLLDYLRQWAEQVRREIDTEIKVEDALPRETAIEVPEERFAYLLTLIYRFLSRSPDLGDPTVSAAARGESIAVTVSAGKTEERRLSERAALGITDHYLRLISRELAACGATWYFDETKDRFSVVVTLERSRADVSRLLAPIPAALARAVRAALHDTDKIRRRSF